MNSALESLGVPQASRTKILGQAEAWTGSYRVLEQREDGATIRVVVEVEIDDRRLAKAAAVSPATAKPATRVPVIASWAREDPCPAFVREVGSQRLLATGVFSERDPNPWPMVAALTCEDLGPVAYTDAWGVRVRITICEQGSSPQCDGTTRTVVTREAVEFAGQAEDAWRLAAGQASAAIARAMRVVQGAQLRVELVEPWPAARVRRVEKLLGEAVVDIRGVTVAGITADGAVQLAVDGPLSAEELADRIDGRTLTGGGALRVVDVGDGLVRVRIGG
ncbi:MAG: hypothetical protein R3A51_21845 [Nannocystaceae bacterium]|nr:hypothetical protein [Myxococcales bacterium]